MSGLVTFVHGGFCNSLSISAPKMDPWTNVKRHWFDMQRKYTWIPLIDVMRCNSGH
jgi:hypothetical protein